MNIVYAVEVEGSWFAVWCDSDDVVVDACRIANVEQMRQQQKPWTRTAALRALMGAGYELHPDVLEEAAR